MRRLQSGQISKSILFAAGDELSKECVKKYSKGVGYSEVAVTPSFQLKLCKKIYHGGIPTYNGTLEVRLQEITLQMYLVICIYDLHKKILPWPVRHFSTCIFLENIICVHCKLTETEFRGSLCYKLQMHSDLDYYKYLIQIFSQVLDLKTVKSC